MPSGDKKAPRIARNDTDTSLRVERKKTDDELAQRRTSVEEDSDAVVHRARDKADEVLKTARDQADRSDPAGLRESVSRERGKEDELLQDERAVADEELERERGEREKALRELLRLERESTDQHLLVERARSDEALFSRDDFMGMVTHDLRNLLGGIANNAAMILREANDPQSGKTILRRAEGIQRFSARMNRLIGDLVDIASIEAGKLKVAPKLNDATTLVAESIESFQPSASAKRLTLTAQAASVEVLGNFDRERILQVLGNLLSNAIKFSHEGGDVSLRLDRLPGQIRFVVSDTGPGIDLSKSERLFSRFWQADKTDKRGMGLGLYISKSIVEAHGGTIEVESVPGQGSSFAFHLPAA
jgi:signal transduction histidine kinase